VLDVTSGVWSRGPDLPVAVNHAMAATMNDKLYVFGGYQPGNIAQSTVFRLDGSHWRAMTDLPEPRAAGTAVAIGTSVYVAGGITAGGRLADRMLVYDSSTDRWSKAPGMPTPREHLGGAAFGGRVYTVGGRTGEISNTLSTFESFDPATGQWTVLPALPTRRGGLSAAATCNGQVVAAGGEGAVESHGFHGATPTGQPASDPAGGPIGTFAQVEAFDVAAGKWRTLAPLPTPRHGLGVVAIGTVLYTLCGGPHRRPHTAEAAEAIDLAALGSCR
jgi:non-specific serine/threonine protein kinase